MKPRVKVVCPNCHWEGKVRPNGHRWIHCKCGISYQVMDGRVTGKISKEGK